MPYMTGDYKIEHDKRWLYHSYMPKPLPYAGVVVNDDETISLLIKAHRLLGELNGISAYIPDFHLYNKLLMKYESVLSCRLDGLDVSLADFWNSRSDSLSNITKADAYTKALQKGKTAIADDHLSPETVRAVHKVLMANECPDDAGRYRSKQLFTLPKVFSEGAPIYNPPNPEDMLIALADFEKFLSSECGYDALVKAALVYYQFITIQPFMSGNGRTARLLILLFMAENGILSRPLLCLSYFLLTNEGEYRSVLNSVRFYGGYESWIKFFLRAIIIAAEKTTAMLVGLDKLRRSDLAKIQEFDKPSAAVLQVYDYIWKVPIIEVRNIAPILGMSYNTIAKAVRILANISVLEQIDEQKRYRRYGYKKVLDTFQVY